jgi:hypothetical protein
LNSARRLPNRFSGNPCRSQYSRWFKSLSPQPFRCARPNASSFRRLARPFRTISHLPCRPQRAKEGRDRSLFSSVHSLNAYEKSLIRPHKFPVILHGNLCATYCKVDDFSDETTKVERENCKNSLLSGAGQLRPVRARLRPPPC